MQLIIGIEGLSLNSSDIRRLQHACVAGVILFKRNYQCSEQLKALTAEIRQRNPRCFISIDHEGGRVQRLQKGFTQLPSARSLLNYFRLNPSNGLALAECCGIIMGLELQQHGIDLSYAPVLDLDFGLSEVIGDRSFGSLTQEVVALASAVMRGLHRIGSPAIGKHFPGHGGVIADSHHEIAIDPRSLDYLWQADLIPFKQLILQSLDGIMPAHVIYSSVDSVPAGFSKIWLQDILRKQMNFKGVIISDDIDMAGSDIMGDIKTKLIAAATAGCNMALLCNNFDSIDTALSYAASYFQKVDCGKLYGKYIAHIPSNLIELLIQARARLAQLYV